MVRGICFGDVMGGNDGIYTAIDDVEYMRQWSAIKHRSQWKKYLQYGSTGCPDKFTVATYTIKAIHPHSVSFLGEQWPGDIFSIPGLTGITHTHN